MDDLLLCLFRGIVEQCLALEAIPEADAYLQQGRLLELNLGPQCDICQGHFLAYSHFKSVRAKSILNLSSKLFLGGG